MSAAAGIEIKPPDLSGLQDVADGGVELSRQAAQISAQSTFLTANVLGIQAGGSTDRMANGIDKIEKNTRPLRIADSIAFT